jgi:hypothetical protein
MVQTPVQAEQLRSFHSGAEQRLALEDSWFKSGKRAARRDAGCRFPQVGRAPRRPAHRVPHGEDVGVRVWMASGHGGQRAGQPRLGRRLGVTAARWTGALGHRCRSERTSTVLSRRSSSSAGTHRMLTAARRTRRLSAGLSTREASGAGHSTRRPTRPATGCGRRGTRPHLCCSLGRYL